MKGWYLCETDLHGVTLVACVLAVSFDKVRTFDLDAGTSQGHIKAVREQLMTEDTKDVEPLVKFHLLSAKLTPITYLLLL